MSTVTFADIEAAAVRIEGVAVKTPLIESPALNERLGGRILIKPETMQRVGAFKFRGAYNRLVQLSPEERTRGVVAFSSGNHAQGVALAAKLLGIPAIIVMPHDAPAKKVASTKGYGAEVRIYNRYTEDRAAIAFEIASTRGSTIVPPYDDVHIVAGQGTLGLELMQQAQALGVTPDCVITPLGGGGLLSGVALAVKHLSPKTAVVGVEPEGYDDVRRSLQTGDYQTNSPDARTLCDALQTPTPGNIASPALPGPGLTGPYLWPGTLIDRTRSGRKSHGGVWWWPCRNRNCGRKRRSSSWKTTRNRASITSMGTARWRW